MCTYENVECAVFKWSELHNICKLPEADVSDPPTGKKKKNDVPRLEVVLIAKAQQNKDQNSAGLGLLWTLNYGEASIQAVDPTEQNHLTCH